MLFLKLTIILLFHQLIRLAQILSINIKGIQSNDYNKFAQLFKKVIKLKKRQNKKKKMEPNNLFDSILMPHTPIITQNQTQNKPISSQRPSLSSCKQTTIKLTSKTWIKDSYGLFDYQAKPQQYAIQIDSIQETTYIVRNNTDSKTILVKDLNTIETQQAQYRQSIYPFAPSNDYVVLGELVVDRTKSNPSFKLKMHKSTDSNQNQNQQNQFQAVHSHNHKFPVPFILADGDNPKSNGYPLKPGNIIKFGRVEYLVLQIHNGKDTQTVRDSIYLDDKDAVFDVFKHRQMKKETEPQTENQQDKDDINCKICLCNEQTEQDPLISPCDCKGYCGLIHTNCLRTWINNKVKKQNSGLATSYNFTKFVCQICKAPFPKIVRTQNQQVQMMTITKPQRPYIMLQSLDPLNNQFATHVPPTSLGQRERLLHLISTDDKQSIKIGRANQCQIRLMDISVSRRHAEIKLIGNQFYIRDTGSKFGTLVEWKNTTKNPKGDIITINRKKPLKIQLGRTSYQFTVEHVNEDIDTQ